MKGDPNLKVHLRVSSALANKVRQGALRRAVQAAFDTAGKKRSGELTLVITDDAHVRELNRTYRGVDAATDVLAFGAAREAGTPPCFPETPNYLGDIVVSYSRSLEQARTYAHPIEEELILLVVHGTLHLLGYDHEQESDREEMWEAQSAALARLGIDWRP